MLLYIRVWHGQYSYGQVYKMNYGRLLVCWSKGLQERGPIGLTNNMTAKFTSYVYGLRGHTILQQNAT